MPCGEGTVKKPERSELFTRVEREHEKTTARGNGNVLPAVDEERHRSGSNRAAGLKLPERLAVRRIQREHVPFIGTAEDEPARGGQYSQPTAVTATGNPTLAYRFSHRLRGRHPMPLR